MLPEDRYFASQQILLPALQYCSEHNINPQKLLDGLALQNNAQQLLAQPFRNELLTTSQQLTFNHNVRATIRDTDIGLQLGSRASFAALGILGLAMISAPTLAQAMALGGRYSHIGGTLASIHYIDTNQGPGFDVELPEFAADIEAHLIEEQFAAFLSYVKELMHLHNDLPPLLHKISVRHPAPDYVECYHDLFQCTVEFNAEANHFLLTPEASQLAPAYANPDTCAHLRSACQQALETLREQDSLLQSLQQYIADNASEIPKLEDGAAALKLSARALRRRLTDLDTNFSQVVANVKRQQASALLMKNDLSVQDISELLGYSEVANFRRAFKSWTGMSPRDYRASIQTP